MKKSDLIDAISSRYDLEKNKADIVVETVLGAISLSLIQNGRVEIRGFGSFVNRKYNARIGRNPKTGKQIYIKGKSLPFFKTGKELKEKLNLS